MPSVHFVNNVERKSEKKFLRKLLHDKRLILLAILGKRGGGYGVLSTFRVKTNEREREREREREKEKLKLLLVRQPVQR